MPATSLSPAPDRRLGVVAALCSLAAAAAFLIDSPPVGDLWAARARASAAAHGVGLRYWFSWFDGTVPGHYSVLAPYLSRIADVSVLGAVATVGCIPLCHLLLRGTRHPTLGLWVATVVSAFSLWSGRVPFAVGTALMLVALLCIRADRRIPATLAGILTALTSPVSGVFLIIGLAGLFLHDRSRRVISATTAAATGLCLVALAWYFGLPGPEGYATLDARLTVAALAAMLLARPASYVQTVLLLSLAACPIVMLVPNGMGSNFERLAWICLPVATAATARARPTVSMLAIGCAVCSGAYASAHDLAVAAQPMSSSAYSTGLTAELDRTSGLADYRVEVVPDGTHVAAYALLDHAQLARGYETQSDNALNGVLSSTTLDPVTFKVWLDNNAVGYVALDRATLKHGPEDTLVRWGHLPYLTEVWSDQHWVLFRVAAPTPIAAAPARVVDADQSNLVISAPRPMTIALRIRWSHFLRIRDADGAAALQPDRQGWTVLDTSRAGDYVITA